MEAFSFRTLAIRELPPLTKSSPDATKAVLVIHVQQTGIKNRQNNRVPHNLLFGKVTKKAKLKPQRIAFSFFRKEFEILP